MKNSLLALLLGLAFVFPFSLSLADTEPLGGMAVTTNGSPVPDALITLFPDKGETLEVLTNDSGQFMIQVSGKGKYKLSAETEDGMVAAADKLTPGNLSLIITLKPDTALRGKLVNENGEAIVKADIALLEGSTFLWGDEKEKKKLDKVSTNRWGNFRFPEAQGGRYALNIRADGFVSLEYGSFNFNPEGTEPLSVKLSASHPITGLVTDEEGNPVSGAKIIPFYHGKHFRELSKVSENIYSNTYDRLVETAEAKSDAKGKYQLDGLFADSRWGLFISHPDYAPIMLYDVSNEAVETQQNVTLSHGVTLTGTLSSSTGTRLNNARVSTDIKLKKGWRFFKKQKIDPMKALVAPDGQYQLQRLPEGDHEFIASASHHKPEKRSLAFPDDRADDQNFTLEPAPLLTGFIRDTDGNPLEGITVTASEVKGGFGYMSGGEIGSSNSDAEGYFELSELSDDIVRLDVDSDGYARFSEDRIKVPTEKPLEIILKPVGRIEGFVVSADSGGPIHEFSVSFTYRMSFVSQGIMMNTNQYRKFYSEDGRFVMDDLDPGVYTLAISPKGYAHTSPPAVEVVSGETARVDVECERGMSLEGRVVEAATGFPIEGARVDADISASYTSFNAGSATTDSNGGFRFETLAEGVYDLEVSHSDFADTTHSPVMVSKEKKDDDEDIVISLYKGGFIEGTVRGEDGKPLSGEMVMFFSGTSFRPPSTDENGFYQSTRLTPGEYRLAPMSRMNYSKTAKVEETRTTTVNFDFAGTTLKGFVTKRGAPVSGKNITLMPESGVVVAYVIATDEGETQSGSTIKQAMTDETGYYKLENVMSGSYSLGTGSYTKIITVPDVPEFEFNLDLPGGEIHGKVVWADDNRPAPEATVHSNKTASYITDTEGRFNLLDLTEGTYTVTASTGGPTASETIELGKDEVVSDIVLKLPTGDCQVSGRVNAIGNAPLQWGFMYVSSGNWDDAFSVVNQTGDYLVKDLKPGDYKIAAANEGYAFSVKEITLDDEDGKCAGELNFALQAEAEVLVNVMDTSGLPVEGALMTLYDSSGWEIPFTLSRPGIDIASDERYTESSNSHGNIKRSHLPEGSYRLVVELGNRRTEAQVTLAAGETLRTTVLLP